MAGSLTNERLDEVAAELDAARAEAERLRGELAETQREQEQYRTSLPAEVQDYWAWRKRSELVEAEGDRLRVELKEARTEAARLRTELDGWTLLRSSLVEQRENAAASRDAARAELREQAKDAREQAAADLDAHSKELMDAGMKQVLEDDEEGLSAIRRASTVAYAAKYLRGQAPGT